MTKTILYFTAGEKPTNDEITEISKLNAQTTAAFEVVVMRGDLAESTLEYGAGLKAADYVAGTIPEAYSDAEDYPVASPTAMPRPDTLANTQTVVNNGQKVTGVTGSGTVANIAVNPTTKAVTVTLSSS